MAKSLSSLVHELRERIAASSSTNNNNNNNNNNIGDNKDDVALENTFRTVLPSLLHAYVVPSSSANQREVVAVLKLISHVAKTFPRVFQHPTSLLPVIARILPFFADPSFFSRHGLFFETMGSLLSLLRVESRNAYCQFYTDAMFAIQDLLYAQSLCISESSQVRIKCFCQFFHGIFTHPNCLCQLPPNIKPIDASTGILIDITGNKRWNSFATWIVKLLSKCLTDGTHYVQGITTISNVTATCSLLCSGDTNLQMACFDFARIIGLVISNDKVPHENIIRSISTILNDDRAGLPIFRNTLYDTSIGNCLNVVYSSCPEDVVKATGMDLVGVFHQSMQRTKSQELKVALCNTYVRIAKVCSPHIWKPESLVNMICLPDPCVALIDCFRAAVYVLDPDCVGGCTSTEGSMSLSKPTEYSRVGKKRHIQDLSTFGSKRQKLDGEVIIGDAKQKLTHVVTCETEEEYKDRLHASFLSFIEELNTPLGKLDSLSPDVVLRALSMLCLAFCKYPKVKLSCSIVQKMCAWLPWIFEQAKQGSLINLDLSIYLEGIHSILLAQSKMTFLNQRFEGSISFLFSAMLIGSPFPENVLFKNGDDNAIHGVLKLPWSNSLVVTEPHYALKTKCLCLQIVSKIGFAVKMENALEIMDLGLSDESEQVRLEAIISLPIIVMSFGIDMIPHIFGRLGSLKMEEYDKVKKILPYCLGFLSCIYGSYHVVNNLNYAGCKLFLDDDNVRNCGTLDSLLQGFWCTKCDKNISCNNTQLHSTLVSPAKLGMEVDLDHHFSHLLSTFIKLLYDESSEEIQVACVGFIRRILVHGSADILHKTRSEWIKTVKYLLVNEKKSIREAFSTQISSFLEKPILSSLLLNEDGSDFFNMIKDGLAKTEDPQILATLLESATQIMIAVDINSHIFFRSLLLLVDQLDNPSMTVRMIASKLIHKSCCFHVKEGFDLLLSRFVHIRNELFNYLSMSLLGRPKMVREFAEAVLCVELGELVKRMVPVVLPKLLVSQQDNAESIQTLHELVKYLNTDMVPLIVNLLPKVLSFALHRADRQELLSVLQFYHSYTGSDNREIFSVALPELLDELVCFVDGGDSDDVNRRLARVPEMIKEVASVLTGNEDLTSFLKSHFVRLLNSIDRKMLHAEDGSLQRQALQRIKIIIVMMGSHVNTYVPKLMVLLLHAIDKETLQSEGLSILLFFIQQLARESPSSTKHVISQVFAALIPFLEREKENHTIHLISVVQILEELVLKNKNILKQHIREFPLLPSIPALREVNKAIQEARGTITLKDQLRDIIDGLNHENLNVRYMVACELSKLLNLRREDVSALITTGETSSEMDILSSLITSLLRGCAEESRTIVGQRLKLVCADCLGALGAIDPAKVKGVSCQRFKIECSDDDLIFELIHKHLARAFRAAPDTLIQDSAALAIQELLKIAGCEASLDENVIASHSQKTSSSELNKRGQRLWDRFSNYVKEIIAPCLTSRFHLPNMADSSSYGPIYRPSMSFRRWIFSWIKKLTVHATGSRASIFYACRGIVRHDMQTSIYLLPYLVLNVLCHGTDEARRGIAEEILSVLEAAASESSGAAVGGGQSEVCIQAVFTLLDNLGQWVDDIKQDLALSHSFRSSKKQQPAKLKDKSQISSADQDQLLVQCKHVSELLTAIPKVNLAMASSRCQAHARSLMYFESYVREKSGSFNPAAEKSGVFVDEDVSRLMEIYSCLDEPDGLSGLACLRKSLSLQDHILINKKAGNWAEVLTSCEQALKDEPTSVQRHSDVLNCLLNMCHLQAMVTHVDGLISRIPEYKKMWCMQGVQAAWRLGRWGMMDEYLGGADKDGLICTTSENNASFDMDIAKILQAMMKKDQFSVSEKIALSKQSLIASLAAAGMDSYMRAYPFVVKLHMLRELEDFHSLLFDDSFLEKSFHLNDLKFTKVVESWENRLRFTQPSLWAREPLLAFRRLVYGASGLGAQVGNCWLQYTKLCRLAGHYETANRAILEAQACGGPNVHMEKAKLLWSTRRSDGAIAELQQSLLNMPVEVIGSALSSVTSLSLVPLNLQPVAAHDVPSENRDIAKTILLYSKWIHYTGQKQKEDVMCLYSKVKELQPKWEKGFFYMAKYCDEVLCDARKRQEENFDRGPRILPSNAIVTSSNMNTEKRWWSYMPDVLLFYAKGLHRGHKNLFQALPRLLTLWFDFGSFYQRSGSPSDKDLQNVNGKVVAIMRGCLKDLPTYQWLAVLPQLVSRICHQNEDTVKLVKHIITSVLRQYPQQGLWIMAAVSKSTVPSRKKAAAEIIEAARKGGHSGSSNLFYQFESLVDHLIKLCFHTSQAKSRTINLSTEFSVLKRMMPLEIIMPIQQSLTVSLPTCDLHVPVSGSISTTDLPTISGIGDEAEVLSSLQQPKKIVLMGSDGVERAFLCKPKDDLRKDARMMEFTAMINRLLSKYPESRRRKLYIRTFAVIPLTEDCGMVEWVPHTRGLRQILQDIYITCGKFDRQKTNPQIKRIYDQCQQGKMAEDEMLKTKILPMFPPVFHKWFLNTFSEPAAWFRARVAYAHTTAVWSMVGHIVGLGDRHGENILFDSTTGDCVHVDFSCLFDKGLQLDKPELVPFRLTQNMIDGLGITGYEGMFLRVCEITLSVLRSHRETLMSVLETFIHDPLVEWTKSHKSSGVEVQNPHAQLAMSNIEARLQGVVVGVGAAPSLPLAVEGQARRLIAEAVSHKNLGKMYIWWMPWF
ncbi:hypothetical protein ACFE04_013480 [Oxalis oulophora]